MTYQLDLPMTSIFNVRDENDPIITCHPNDGDFLNKAKKQHAKKRKWNNVQLRGAVTDNRRNLFELGTLSRPVREE